MTYKVNLKRVFVKLRYPILFLTVLILVVGYKLSSPGIPSDDSILTQKPCRFPCWYGLIPGRSKLEDVHQIAKEDKFLSSTNFQEYTDGNRVTIVWWHTIPQELNRLLIDDGILYSIEIVPQIEFSLQDVIDLYGEPAAINARLEKSMEGGYVDVELFLYYPQYGLEIEFHIPGGSTLTAKEFAIYPDTLGAKFSVYAPMDSLRDFIAHIYALDEETLDKFVGSITSGWVGFNSILSINPDRTSFYDQVLILTATPSPLP